MGWVNWAADWLRGILAQPWLDAWQPTIASLPDWALLAAGPTAFFLIVYLVQLIRPRARRPATTVDANAEQPLAPEQPNALISALQQSGKNDAAKAPAEVSPNPASITDYQKALTEHTASLISDEARTPATTAAKVSAMPERRASGVPDANEQERKARVFLSSTFLDMRTERETLATDTFPSLKRRFRARGVEVQEVDLRWGVNEGDATLEVCLQAVRRSNWFVGLIGQRYGTTLDDTDTVALLGEDYPAVRQGLGKSLTEIEILEGVLLNARGDKQTLFFERSETWLGTLSPGERLEYEDTDPAVKARLADLKARIRKRVGDMQVYASPQDIDTIFEQKMSEALEAAFPPIEGASDPFFQEHQLHAAYARERLGLYVGGERYIVALNAGIEAGDAPQLVLGASGSGKSALLANWIQQWCAAHPRDIVFAHYLGASPESAGPAALVRRLWLHLNAVTEEEIAPPQVDAALDDLLNALVNRLGQANAFAVREDCRILIALDGLDKLAEDHRDLRWWPRTLPPRVRFVASSLDGKAREAARERGWTEHSVEPFDQDQQSQFIGETLRGWNKSDFPEARRRRVLGHKLAGLPLFLKTILEELRVSAANDVLDARLDDYLKAQDMPDLFVRILAQIESECGKAFVAQALSLVWAGRAGLEEDEIIAIVSETLGMPPGPAGLSWERLRNRLAENLRDSCGFQKYRTAITLNPGQPFQ